MGLHGLISMRKYEASRDRSHHYNSRYHDHGTLLLQCLRRTRLRPKKYVVTCLSQSAAHACTLRRVTCVVTTESFERKDGKRVQPGAIKKRVNALWLRPTGPSLDGPVERRRCKRDQRGKDWAQVDFTKAEAERNLHGTQYKRLETR